VIGQGTTLAKEESQLSSAQDTAAGGMATPGHNKSNDQVSTWKYVDMQEHYLVPNTYPLISEVMGEQLDKHAVKNCHILSTFIVVLHT
jgi:hypothetical protein